MIKLFRKIRQKLITKNHFSKYLIYAIGEIALVMIGILLAVQVNNWNNKRTQTKKEEAILKELQEDLGVMLNDLNGDYEVLKFGKKGYLNVQDYINTNAKYNDTMAFDFHWLIKDEYIYPVTSAYEQLKEEGFEIIQNDTIKNEVRGIFEFALPRISKINPFYPDLEEFFGSFYRKNFTPNSDSTLVYKYKMYGYDFKYPYKDNFEGKTYNVYFGYIPNNFESLKKNSEFKMLLRQSSIYRNFKVNRYRTIIYRLKRLDSTINRELNRRHD